MEGLVTEQEAMAAVARIDGLLQYEPVTVLGLANKVDLLTSVVAKLNERLESAENKLCKLDRDAR